MIRNHESLPDSVSGTDIDLLIHPADLRSFDRLITERCTLTGWKILRKTTKDFRIRNYVVFGISDSGDATFLVIDVLTAVGWNGRTVWKSDDILAHVQTSGDVHILSEPVEAAITTVTSLLYAGEFKKPEYRRLAVEIANGGESEFSALFCSFTGGQTAGQIVQLIGNDAPQAFDLAAGLIRKSLSKSLWRHPFRWLSDFVWKIRFSTSRIMSPPGVLIAVVGTDGSGKSTVLDRLVGRLKPIFGRAEKAHLRPRLLPDISRISGRDAPSESSNGQTHVRSPGFVGSLVRWCYYWVDYLVGFQVVFRPKLARKTAIFVDRYFYDFEFDHGQKNVKLPQWIIRGLQSFLPKPDVVIRIDTDTQIVLERRGAEVDSDEIDRQRAALGSIVRRLHNAGTVDGARDPEQVERDAVVLIAQVLSGSN